MMKATDYASVAFLYFESGASSLNDIQNNAAEILPLHSSRPCVTHFGRITVIIFYCTCALRSWSFLRAVTATSEFSNRVITSSIEAIAALVMPNFSSA